MTTAVADRRAPVPAGAPPFTATLASEWIKLWTVPFARRMSLLALVLASAASAVFMLTTAVTEGTPLGDMAPLDAAAVSLLGADLAVLVLIMVGASAAASEFSTGMVQRTLTATPRRWRPLTAKTVVLTTTALAVGTVAALGAFGSGRLVLAAGDVPAISANDPRVLRLFLGSVLMAPFYSLLAVAFGFVVRNTGGAVALVLTIMSLPALVNALPEWGRATLLPWLPASALHSLSGSAAPTAAEYLPTGAAAAVLAAWAGLLLALAAVSLQRRDA